MTKEGPRSGRLADILQVDVRTIRRAIKKVRQQGVKIQTRGFYHDIGPSISHKAWIVRLYLEYKTYSEIARTTRHSTTSIKRYITDFSRVVLCLRKGLNIVETAHIAGISERLAKEYAELYLQYNSPEYAERLEDLIIKASSDSLAGLEKGGPVAS